MLITGIAAVVLAFIVSVAVVEWTRRNAERLGLVAVPNDRSSHVRPTPRGGGIGLVAGATAGAAVLLPANPAGGTLLLALSLMVAAVGLADDVRPQRPVFRLAAEALAFGLAMLLVLPMETLAAASLPWLPMPVFAAGLLIALLYWLNLFNFMDGIDGLAASEAIFLCAAGVLLSVASAVSATDYATLWWLVVVAAASAGLLVFNWPPARVFMGDAGSLGLAFLLAMLALLTVSLGWISVQAWLVLIALFVADATVTLLRRLARRENVLAAHRLHAYQHLARRFGSHRTVTVLYMTTNVALLLPLAAVALFIPRAGWWCVGLAYAATVAFTAAAGAGQRQVS